MKMIKDRIIDDFHFVDFTGLKFPIIAVYENPSDCIEPCYMARLWDTNCLITDIVVIRDTLDELRQTIPGSFFKVERMPNDEIIEVWI